MTSFPGQFASSARRTLTWLAVASFVVAGVLAGVIVGRAVPTHSPSPAQVQVASDVPPGSGVDPRYPGKPDNPSIM
jgi:hypothetical protein